VEVFEAIGTSNPSFLSNFVFLLGPVLPMLMKLPTARNRLVKKLNTTMGTIADELLARTRKEKEGAAEEKSIIGLLSMFFEPHILYS
jgi:hypothetical protein